MQEAISSGTRPPGLRNLGSPARKRAAMVTASNANADTFFSLSRKTLFAMEESRASRVPWGNTSTSPQSMSLTIELNASKDGSRDWRTMLSTVLFSSMRSKMCISTAPRRYFLTISSVSGMIVTGQ